MTGPTAEYIPKHPTYPKGIQEPTLLLRGKQTDNVLDTIERYSGSEGLPTPMEHSG